MDDLAEVFYGLLVFAAGIFFLFVVPGLAIRANRKANDLQRDLKLLKAEIAGLHASSPIEPATAEPAQPTA